MTDIEDLARAPALVIQVVDALPRELDEDFISRATALAKRAEIEHPINKAPSTIAGAAVYLTGLLEEQRFTQREVASAGDACAMAIRGCYPEIAQYEEITIARRKGAAPETEVFGADD